MPSRRTDRPNTIHDRISDTKNHSLSLSSNNNTEGDNINWEYFTKQIEPVRLKFFKKSNKFPSINYFFSF